MIKNSVKTAVLTTRDSPCKILQCAIVGATEETVAALSSAANLRQIARQKRKTEFGHPATPNTAADLIVPPNLRQTLINVYFSSMTAVGEMSIEFLFLAQTNFYKRCRIHLTGCATVRLKSPQNCSFKFTLSMH